MIKGMKRIDGVWKHFNEILKIPRGSGNEEGVRNYIIKLCKSKGIGCKIDSAGNLLVKKKAAKGKERVAPLLLQSHMDMVTEKNSEVKHDFTKDKIRAFVTPDGKWMKAEGTTLGADNGIGVAMMLAIIESEDISHGPLELLFTVEEESGLVGAANLETREIESRRMINLDSEEEGTAFISCAGGARLKIRIAEEKQPIKGEILEIAISGLKGGHSGADIHLNRANAIKLLFKILERLQGELRIIEIIAGNKSNAIPREARAVIKAEDNHQETKNRLQVIINEEIIRHKNNEEEIKIELQERQSTHKGFSREMSKMIINLINKMPNGVLFMSKEIEGLVQTSINLGVINTDDGSMQVMLASRSSKEEELDWLTGTIRALASEMEFEEGERYPGWQPSANSKILEHVKKIYRGLTRKELKVKGIHAGLECGVIGSKIPGLDMVSIGPEVRNAHSPGEKVSIESADMFYELVKNIIETLE